MVKQQALAESPTPARVQMRRYTEFGIRVLMSARVAATGVHTSVCAGDGDGKQQKGEGKKLHRKKTLMSDDTKETAVW